MKNEFIPYDLAVEMKELGFNESCFAFSDVINKANVLRHYKGVVNSSLEPTEVAFPLFQQAFRWFRDNHNIMSWVYKFEKYQYNVNLGFGISVFKDFYTYEEAEIECLKKLIEIVKTKKS